jgi:hypothetical protein
MEKAIEAEIEAQKAEDDKIAKTGNILNKLGVR